MLAPILSAADYAGALLKLLPRGRAWSRDADTTRAAAFTAFGATFARLSARAVNLLTDAFPASTLELLPEWESSLGLPDPCAGVLPTVEARRAQVVARFANSGGQSAAHFIAFAAQLGYAVTVESFAPFRAGRSHAGDALMGGDWAYAWAILAPLYQINYFSAGVSAAGEPLAYWSNAVLECELNSIKPAHTVLLFEYS